MTYDELKSKIDTLSNDDLYHLARSYLLSEFQGLTHNSRKLDLLYDQCQARNIKIFDEAIADASSQLRSIEEAANSEGMRAAIIRRIDFLKNHELEILVSSTDKDGLSIIDPITKEKALLDILDALRHKDAYFFFVRGDSMAGEGINNGDLISADIGAEPRNGNTVLVLLNNTLLVKNYQKDRKKITLKSSNPEYPDIVPSEHDEFEIIGVVRFVMQRK